MKSKVLAVLLVVLVAVLVAGCSEPMDEAEREALRLAKDYRSELDGVELTIDKLELVSNEGKPEQRSLVVAYETEAGDDRELFNQEILSLIQPAANDKYGLVDVMILATDGEGVLRRGVSIDGDDLREWAGGDLTVEEFIDCWVVTGF